MTARLMTAICHSNCVPLFYSKDWISLPGSAADGAETLVPPAIAVQSLPLSLPGFMIDDLRFNTPTTKRPRDEERMSEEPPSQKRPNLGGAACSDASSSSKQHLLPEEATYDPEWDLPFIYHKGHDLYGTWSKKPAPNGLAMARPCY